MFGIKNSEIYGKKISIKKRNNPPKAIIAPTNRGINERNALIIIRIVPIIKQNIINSVLNVAISLSDTFLIFFNYIAVVCIYNIKLKLNKTVYFLINSLHKIYDRYTIKKEIKVLLGVCIKFICEKDELIYFRKRK
jgi:hypothetical protein